MSQHQIGDKSIFSLRLRSLRKDMKKASFARFLGISNPQNYQRYEDGRIPDAVILQEIANRCGVTVDWLLGREDSIVLASDEVSFIKETELQTDKRTQKLMDDLRHQANSICRAPEDFDAFKRQIDFLIEEYRKWCIANYPNEVKRQKHESRKMLEEDQKANGGGG